MPNQRHLSHNPALNHMANTGAVFRVFAFENSSIFLVDFDAKTPLVRSALAVRNESDVNHTRNCNPSDTIGLFMASGVTPAFPSVSCMFEVAR